MSSPLLLHITDAHVTGHGVEVLRDDHKVDIPGVVQATREGSLELLLTRIAERLDAEGRTLEALVFSGDAADRGDLGGHRALLDILLDKLGKVGIVPGRIVATPGNHDVPRGTAPGSAERYEAFIRAWRDKGCVTPWLDRHPARRRRAHHHRAARGHIAAVFRGSRRPHGIQPPRHPTEGG